MWLGRCGLGDVQALPPEDEDGVATSFGEQRYSGSNPLYRWFGRDSEHDGRDAGSLRVERMVSARDVVRPVIDQTRLAPSSTSACGTSLTLPAPNRTSVGTARSKRTTRLPVRVFGGRVDVARRLTRPGHHRRNDVTPPLVVTVSLCAAAASSSR